MSVSRPPRTAPRVLIADDDRSIRRTLDRLLQSEGYGTVLAANGREALEQAPSVDVVLLDLGMPRLTGLQVLEQLDRGLTTGDERPAVVVVSARDDLESTVAAMRHGAFDYLVKPLDIDHLLATVQRAWTARQQQHAQTAASAAPPPIERTLVGTSPPMRSVAKRIGQLARTRVTTLITGESGTGKELVARHIHFRSADRDHPFVALNCAALAGGLLETELFGHARGAFTGAVAAKVGRLEQAGQGTLFLDEVGEMPLDLQTKFLRVLQERSFERVGEGRSRTFAARVVAATHRDLDRLVHEGRFREDLLYRLRVVPVKLPPLRARREDIPLLVEALLARTSRELGLQVRGITPEALQWLQEQPWPGNVRQLQNALTRAVALSWGDQIGLEQLRPDAERPRPEAPPAEPTDLPSLRDVERAHVARVLQATGWNKRQAARILEVSRPTLDRKIATYGLVAEDASEP